MRFLRKQFILLICISCIYAAFFIVHFHVQKTETVLGVGTNLALFEEPMSGKDPIISTISNAQKEVDVEVYLLSDKDIITSLLDACGRGVVVKVMLEQHPFGGGSINQKTHQQLQNTCVHIQWTNPAFALTHEKTILIDGRQVFILNQNLTNAAFSSNREYDILDTNPQDVGEIQKIFTADWNRSSFASSQTNLVVSPLTSRDILSSLISHATKTLDIEMEVIEDPDIATLLKEKARSTAIRIIIPTFSQISSNKKIAQQLQQSGVEAKTMGSPYIHAKLILADNAKAYVGSVNLTTQSMDSNREVGIILSQQDVLAELSQDFDVDWENASNF